MVLVLMGEQHGIELLDAGPQHLLPEIRTGVDHERPLPLWSVGAIDLEQGARAEALVPGILGRADPAVTRDDGHPLRGAGAEKGEVNAHAGQS